MSVNAELVLVTGSLAEALLQGTQPLVPEPSEGDTLDLEGYWHGLQYMLTGSEALVPGAALEGEAIISRHKVPNGDSDLWVVTADEVPALADALENLDRREMQRRYDEIQRGEAQLNWETAFELGSTRSHVFALLDALTVFYRLAAEAEAGVLISIA